MGRLTWWAHDWQGGKLYTWITLEFKPNEESSNIHVWIVTAIKREKLSGFRRLIMSQKRKHSDLYKQNYSCNLKISHQQLDRAPVGGFL